MSALTTSPAWTHLVKLATHSYTDGMQGAAIQACGLTLDYTRQRMNDAVRDGLLQLAEQQDVAYWRAAMVAGKPINHTENRAVLHMALRAPNEETYMVDGVNVSDNVRRVKYRMMDFAENLRQGNWRGATKKCITSVVNIGIGGSDLGPRMATRALDAYHDQELDIHFVSNVDATHLLNVLRTCNPETTLFIIASKTFTTIETLTNANTARNWVVSHLGEDAVPRHFVAVSSAREKVEAFGIDPQNMFEFWDWVGGRYSVWSAIGLPLMIAIGAKQFDEFLHGAAAMDHHFREAPLHDNMPVMMALTGIWNRNFQSMESLAVLPYDQLLQDFPAFLQQLDMESNGKSVDRDGQRVDYATGPLVFGDVGTNGQHAFYQLLHQGTSIVPCDFIVVEQPPYPRGDHRKILVANALAQPDALWRGRSLDDAKGNPWRVFDGNRPSNVIRMEKLTPYTLGALIALYEHKVFVQSVIWNINAFDQFGVELGKEMALTLLNQPASL